VSTIETKQLERYKDVVKFYQELIDKYPESSYLKKAEKLYDISMKASDRLAKLEEEYRKAREKEKSNTTKVGAAENQK
jgi:outer membrane protein assembly factor BamD